MEDLAIEEILSNLNFADTPRAVKAVERLHEMKGKAATIAIAEVLAAAPAGPVTACAAAALERRRHKSCQDIVLKVYETRPELWEDVIPVLAAVGDEVAVNRVIKDSIQLMGSSARLTALELFQDRLDKSGLCRLLIELRFGKKTVPAAAHEDLSWALESALKAADDPALSAAVAHARQTSVAAIEFVQPYLPPQSELEREAPRVARELIAELEARELIELVPDSADALVEQLARTMIEANSPKALLRDVERILINSPATEEFYADSGDLRTILTKVSQKR